MESDLHRKIVLRQDVIIQGPEYRNIPGLSENDDLVLLKCDNDIVTITPVMREILYEARNPHTPDELIRWVAQAKECSYESVYQPTWTFLKRMGKLGVLVYEEIEKSTTSHILEELEEIMSFAGFTLLERLSKSHKAALYKCVSAESYSLFFTLKILLKRQPAESEQRKFFREYEILRSLPAHNNIRNCFQAAEHHGIPFLLFDYIEGVSISIGVDKFTLEAKCSIAHQLMKAIHHLHVNHILHGDIHASNFLISNENELYLIDLGMAHSDDERGMHHGGIPRYMPPERMPDHPFDFSMKNGDYVSEVFQVGICLYFLLSGNYPFNGLLLKHLAKAIKYEDPKPLIRTPLGEMIPPSLAGIIYKALAKDPAKRYPRVADMIQVWESVIEEKDLVSA